MPVLGKYCKAYPVERFCAFRDWKEQQPFSGDAVSLQMETTSADDKHPARPRYLYLHEDLIVTKSIWTNKDIVFDDVTPEWREFCRTELHFEAPLDLPQAPKMP